MKTFSNPDRDNLYKWTIFVFLMALALFIFSKAFGQELSGTWVPLNPKGIRPKERVGWQKIVYDEQYDVIWLFAAAGGELYQAYANDLWLYYVETNTWKEIQKISPDRNPPNRPSWRHAEQGRTYDANLGLIILFGQQSNAGPKNDTWTFDVGTLSWEEIKPTGDIPPLPHFEYALEYDRTADVSVLWGGNRAYTYPYPSDVWELNLKRREWKKYSFSPPKAPIGRRAHALAYCDSLKGIIMFGGSSEYGDNPSQNYNDVWLYKASEHTWTQLQSINPPPGRRHFSFDYDPINNVCLMFSGGIGIEEVEEVYSDTWLYDVASGRWHQVYPDTTPPPYGGGDMLVYSRKHKSFFLMSEDGNIWKFVYSGKVPASVETEGNHPIAFRLIGNFPNPFNPETEIVFEIDRPFGSNKARIDIFSVSGRKVRTLLSSPLNSKKIVRMIWDGKDDYGQPLPSGIYPYQIQIGNQIQRSKMVLVK